MADTLEVDFRVTDLRCGANTLSTVTRLFFVVQNPVNNPPFVRTSLTKDTLVVLMNPAIPVSYTHLDVYKRQ